MRRCTWLIFIALACTPAPTSSPPATPLPEGQTSTEGLPAESSPAQDPRTEESPSEETPTEAPPAEEPPENPKSTKPASGNPCTVWTGGPRGDAKPPADFTDTVCPDGEQCLCDRAGGYSCSGSCG